MKELNGFLGEEYIKYGDADGRLYLAYLDAKNQRAKFLSEMVKRCDTISEDIKSEIMHLVDETYAKSYKGMMKAFKAAEEGGVFEQATKDIAVNANVLKQAINNNISKLTLPAVLEKHRNEVIYQIQQQLNIGLMQGDRYEQMAKRISERVGVSESKAKNIVRTESHRNVESGFMDCAERIQEGLDGSDLIYAATWCTMKDERVRPQQRRKTKKGWKTTRSRNGANHKQMEGKTVKAGELFDLGGDAKAKAPGESGVAAHDCNCRCFLEYNLMTAEEFAEATGRTAEKPILTPEETIEKVKQIADELEKSTEVFDSASKCFEYIQHRQGNDGLPKVVSADDFEAVSKNKTKLYRGYHNDTFNKKTVDEMIDEFKYGKLWCGNTGGSAYGRGTYFTPDESVASKDYAYGGGKIIAAVLDESTKIVDCHEILKEFYEAGQEVMKAVNDPGSYAAIKGYDVIALNGYMNKQHYVVLDRRKLIIKE